METPITHQCILISSNYILLEKLREIPNLDVRLFFRKINGLYEIVIIHITPDLHYKYILLNIEEYKIQNPNTGILLIGDSSIYEERYRAFREIANYILEEPFSDNLLIYTIGNCFHRKTLLRDINYHGIQIENNRGIVHYKGSKIYMTKKEINILCILLDSDRIVEREEILQVLDTKKDTTYLRVLICRIRKKFRDVSGLNIIKSKYGKGYYISI